MVILETICVYFLCKYNATNAKVRGRRSGNAYVYTVVLWFGFVIISMQVLRYASVGRSGITTRTPTIIQALLEILFVAIGAGISIALSRRGDLEGLKQNQLTAQEYSLVTLSEPLDYPCQVTITREPSVYDQFNYPLYIQVNGQFVGTINSKQTIHCTTNSQLNIVSAGHKQTLRIPSTYSFTASPGGQANILIKGCDFIPEQDTVSTT